jgi:Replication initiator protein A
MSLLLPERHPVRDFFVLDVLDLAPRADMASMEHPIFSLSTKPEQRPLIYEHDGKRVEVVPSGKGSYRLRQGYSHLLYFEADFHARRGTADWPLCQAHHP